MTDLTEIPSSAWQGVTDPEKGLHKTCFTCGGTRVRDLPMVEAMCLPDKQMLNEHTYMIPGKAWGYLQCDDCEAAALGKAKAKPWWKFW